MPSPRPSPPRGEGDRITRFLNATADDSAESIALRTLTLHMLSHLAPRLFAERNLATAQQAALARCASVDCGFDRPLDADRIQAGVDAWYCRHLEGLLHAPPATYLLRTALEWLADDQLIFAWLIGEQAARCGLDVRVPVGNRPFAHSRLHHAYWLTHLVMLDTDYFARPLTSPDANAWADELASLVPWLEQQPNDDLAGEVAFCLHFMGRDARAAIALVEQAAPTADAHAQATVLLALSAERH